MNTLTVSRYLRPHLIFIILLFNLVPESKGSDYPFERDAGIDSIISKYRELIPERIHKERVPGFSVAVVDRVGVIWMEGFGFTDFEKTKAVDLQTIFSIQSISKTFTATAIMHAVQEGLLDLDEPITTYLPDFTVNSCFEENPVSKMTLKILLNHRAGFTHEAPIGNNYDASFNSFEEHVLSIQETWLKFPVGERYSYSNLGIDLAGYILQKVSGMPFDEYVRKNIFEPLGMENSSFNTHRIINHANRATGNDEIIPEIPVAIPIIPSGGMYSSAEDMAKYIRFHLNKGNVDSVQVLSPEIMDIMYTIPFGYPGQNFGYALGIERMTRHNALIFNHGGGGFGFLSFMMWYPEYGFGVMTLSNSTNHNLQYEMAHGLADEIVQNLKAKLNITNEEPVSGFPAQEGIRSLPTEPGPDKPEWKKWVGNYRIYLHGYSSWRERITVKNGYLHYAGMQLEEYLPGLFFAADGEALDLRGEVPTFRNIKLEKMEFPALAKILMGIVALAFLVFLIGHPVLFIVYKSRKRKPAQQQKRLSLLYQGTATFTSLLGLAYTWLLLFYIPFILGCSWPWHPFYPPDIKVVWLMPYVWLVLTIILIIFLTGTKQNRYRTKASWLIYAVQATGTLVFLAMLVYWKQFSFF